MHRDDDAEIIAAARVGFLDEAADMLQQFEQALLVMETDPADAENLNAAFRAAHTIKGTSGLFGFDAVVLFTHDVETLLEDPRSGPLPFEPTLGMPVGGEKPGHLTQEGSKRPLTTVPGQPAAGPGPEHLRMLQRVAAKRNEHDRRGDPEQETILDHPPPGGPS